MRTRALLCLFIRNMKIRRIKITRISIFLATALRVFFYTANLIHEALRAVSILISSHLA